MLPALYLIGIAPEKGDFEYYEIYGNQFFGKYGFSK